MPAKKKTKPAPAKKAASKKAKPAPKPKGRPSLYSKEIAGQIIARLSQGETLASITREPGMPAPNTVYDWKAAHEGFSGDFARARDLGFDALADQTMEIADDERHDWRMSQKGTITDEVAIARARLRIDTRLKLLAKWDPRRYGDRLAIDQTVKTEKPTREEFVADLTKSKALRDELRGMLDEAEKAAAVAKTQPKAKP